jgi:hypothetical protein
VSPAQEFQPHSEVLRPYASCLKLYTRIEIRKRDLTFGGTVDNIVLLGSVLENALAAKHFRVIFAEEFYLLLGVGRTVSQLNHLSFLSSRRI